MKTYFGFIRSINNLLLEEGERGQGRDLGESSGQLLDPDAVLLVWLHCEPFVCFVCCLLFVCLFVLALQFMQLIPASPHGSLLNIGGVGNTCYQGMIKQGFTHPEPLGVALKQG